MKFLKKLFSKEEKKEPQSEVLLEERSPVCPITAIVEQDDRVVYFYLWGDENTNFGTKACWVRNLINAPEKLGVDPITPPVMPRQFCKFPEGQSSLKSDDLTIVWSEEGDAASLYEKDEMIASIPSWGGTDEFFGYARDANGRGNFAWELGIKDHYFERFEKSGKYWDDWYAEEGHFYFHQPIILESYERLLGKSDKYYTIDGGDIPLKGLYLRKGNVKTVFATVCLSLVPQPKVESYFENPKEANRIELGLMLNSPFSEDDFDQMARTISSIAAVPWDNITWIGEGHTINFDFPNSDRFNSILFTSKLSILPKIELENYRGSKVNFLWMVPLTDSERRIGMEEKSDDLINKLNLIGEEILSLKREEITFK